MIKVELHTHSADDPVDWIPYSSTQLIDRAVSLGYGALAITLHDRQLDLHRLRPYAAERGLVLIPGIERTLQGRHVLLLNFSRAAERVRDFRDLVDLRNREQGLVIAPHPFFPTGTCLRELVDRHADAFDAVEWNAMFTRSINFNLRAERWATQHGKPMVGNCDVHRLHQLGSCYTLVDGAPDADSICEAIRAGRVEVHAEPLSLARATYTMGSMVLGQLAHRPRRVLTATAPPRPQPDRAVPTVVTFDSPRSTS